MAAFALGAFARSLPWTAGAVVVLLLVTFAAAASRGRHRYVDVTWGLAFVAVAAVAFVASAEYGDATRRVLLLVLTAVWGLRLAAHLLRRNWGKGEDPRYAELLGRAPRHPNRYALRMVYLTQGVVLFVVSMPVQVGMFEHGELPRWAWVGVALWVVGLVFEAGGDWQLARFSADPRSRGRVLDSGLWRYTRHPNYFGDACVWWGLSLVAFGRWPGILTLPAPVLMTYLLARGTGKPLLEKRMQQSRPGYADYVRRTSGFLPRPPKRV